MIVLILIFIILPAVTIAAPDLCDILKVTNCAGVTRQGRRSSSQSLPSTATSSNLNPANISFDRGVGIEFTHQTHNSVVMSLASGTGKLGGALINSSLENSFFGNRVIELPSEYLKRNEEKKQFKPKKLTLALGARLYQRKNVSVDVGVILKRGEIIKSINTGLGLSAKLGPLHLGASTYKDDSAVLVGSEYLEEKFVVQTYSIGTRIRNLSLDAGVIQTEYKEYDVETTVLLYSAAFHYQRLLFNLAYRNEVSPHPKYVHGELTDDEEKADIYAGLQCSFGKHLILGVQYNYFLLRETSLTATVFF